MNSQTHCIERSNIGAKANMNVEPAPRIVRILNHHILIARRSAITPKDGLATATKSAAMVTAKDQTASEVMSLPRIVASNPFAFRKR